MDTLEKLELKVQKAKEAVKRAKLAFCESINDYEKGVKKRIFKSARTKLTNAKLALKEARPKGATRQKMSDVYESVKNTIKKVPVKKAASWTGLAIVTVVTGIAAYVGYDYFNKDDEAEAQDSM